MTLIKTSLAIALSLAAAAAQADTFTGALDMSTGSAHFGRDNANLSFVDTYTFNIATPGYLISVSASSASPDADHDLDFTSLVIMDAMNQPFATLLGNSGTDANEAYALPATFIPAGDYSLVITGNNSVGQAAYSGNLSTSAPVPEPETYAMMLAGLALMGVVARRRLPAKQAV